MSDCVIFHKDNIMRCSRGTLKHENIFFVDDKSSHSTIEARRLEAPCESRSPSPTAAVAMIM